MFQLQFGLLFSACLTIFLAACNRLEDPNALNTLTVAPPNITIHQLETHPKHSIIWCGGDRYSEGWVGTLDTAYRLGEKALHDIAYDSVRKIWLCIGIDSKLYFARQQEFPLHASDWTLYQLNPWCELKDIQTGKDLYIIGNKNFRSSFLYNIDTNLNYTHDSLKYDYRVVYSYDNSVFVAGYGNTQTLEQTLVNFPSGDVFIQQDGHYILGIEGKIAHLGIEDSRQLDGNHFVDVASPHVDTVFIARADGKLYKSSQNLRQLSAFTHLKTSIQSIEYSNRILYIGTTRGEILYFPLE